MDSWIPHPGPQEEFCSRGEFEVLFGGSAGPGKTDCLILEATRHTRNPLYRGLLLRRTFPQLQEIIDRCWTYYPMLGGVYRSTEHRWYFPSGAIIALGHMQHEADMYNYQGKQYHFIGFDEVTQFTEKQYLYLFSRCRSAIPDIPPRIRATTNPGGIGHMWCKRRFIDPVPAGQTFIDPETGLSRVFVSARVYDNPTLVDNDPAYVKRLEALPEIERRRLLDGDWEVFEGQMFPELTQRVHGIDPFDVPPEWERYMVMDWGFARPFSCGWYAVDYDGNLFRYREYYGMKENEPNVGLRMIAQDVAREINSIEFQAGESKNIRRIADPSIWNKLPGFRNKEVIGQTIAEDMQGEGLFFLKGDNDRLQGIQQVHRRFKHEIEIDKESGEVIDEHVKFYAFNDQVHFWRTMQGLQASPKNPDDVDTDGEDHIYDEVRYMCMARPVRPKKRDDAPKGTFQSERNRLIKAKQYARRHGVSLQTAYTRVR